MHQMTSKQTKSSRRFLSDLGVFGYEPIESIILASLVTADPLLLIGSCGTGKTFLLNNLSEALGLVHRHYNASLISFDDLVGFPYPIDDFTKIRYLETPATVWEAESVLVDEISRCKPEHQNRLFSLIQERRIQGIEIKKLRYRWAAMNPCTSEQDGNDLYEGSEPLDQALADRFAFVVEVPDWADFKENTHRAIACPVDTKITPATVRRVRSSLKKWRGVYAKSLKCAPEKVIEYCRIAATELGAAEIRFSPRRVRQLVKNILALLAVNDGLSEEKTFRLALRWSFPHRGWGVDLKEGLIRAVHRTAWDSACSTGAEKWLSEFHLDRSLPGKIERLASGAPDPDTATLAVTQLLAGEPKERSAAFAYAVYPAALKGQLEIGLEGVAELAKAAKEVLDVKGEINWNEHSSKTKAEHPEYARLAKVLSRLKGNRRERASQFFNYLLVADIYLADPKSLEEEFDQCIKKILV
jgi:MoxR-like ATPase